MIFALNMPLIIMQRRLEEVYQNRNDRWTKYPVAFFAQVIPMIVLLASGFLFKN